MIDQLTGHKQVGDDVYTTLDPKAQRIAVAQLAGRKGSVVALDPRTGAIKVMASSPSYDPNLLRAGQSAVANLVSSGQSLQNRATQAAYLPGSTFKVVTAIAAIDSGRYTPDSMLSGASPITISGVPLANDAGETFGVISLTQALTNSVEHGLRAGRRRRREVDDGQVHEPPRLRRAPADRPSARASGDRAASTPTAG